MNKVLNLTYASSLTRLCEVNSSFDSGVLRIAYPGENNNKSYIDKKTFEKCLKTIYNCPIVCNYDRDSDTLGGHDMEVVRDSNGSLKLINVTTPVGCIPESANVFWENVTEEDGTEHEYLCADALLWKRQEAYQKIKRDGFAAQSMEITVKDGESVDGLYKIYDFEFTAFALIGVSPCFESASLEFSKQDFKQQFAQMMLEMKECFSQVKTSSEDDINQKEYSMEGGEKVLNEDIKEVEELEVESDTDTKDVETTEADDAQNTGAVDENNQETGTNENFALAGNLESELVRVLESEKVEREWGECTRYWFVDYDPEAKLVYCWDTDDWLLYGFEYEVNGDAVSIKQDSKKRKKFDIVDFDEGDQPSPVAQVFAMMEEKIKSNTGWEAKYQTASDTIASLETELGELRQFKSDAEAATAKAEKDEVFAKFEDLIGVEAFEKLKEDRDSYDVIAIEEKCFAIRGRNTVVKFSAEQSKAPVLKVEKTNIEKASNAPYGGIFEEYGVGK